MQKVTTRGGYGFSNKGAALRLLYAIKLRGNQAHLQLLS